MQYLRRSVWFVARKLLVVTLIVGLFILVFYLFMNLANINILLQDGLKERASVILGINREENRDLSRYFTERLLAEDPLLDAARDGSDPYLRYTVRDFGHRTEIEWFWCWPWENTASARVVERLPYIDGELPVDEMDEAQLAQYRETDERIRPPDWKSGRYNAVLVKDAEGRWKIDEVRLIEYLET